MSVWDDYSGRMAVRGHTKRDAMKVRENRYLERKMPTSLSYFEVTIDDTTRNCAVINSDNMNQKTLLSLPGEDLPNGGVVSWAGQHWLITSKDYNNEVYTRAFLEQCNYELKWVSEVDGTPTVVSCWSIVEDGTKYLTGEYGDNQFILVRGDTRMYLTVPRNKYTAKLDRENRFIIDDTQSDQPLTYRLTKPFKLGGTFTDEGVYRFVVSECTTEDSDDIPNHIPNYYKYFPRSTDKVESTPGTSTVNGKKVWL